MNDTVTRTASDTLRAVADFLDAYPDLPSPYITVSTAGGTAGATWGLGYGVSDDDQKASAVRIMRTIGGKWDKDFDWPDGQDRADFEQVRDGITLRIVVQRTAVCERIVVGTEEVRLPAVEAQPERTEVRELVEWRCEPVLAEASA